MRSNLRASNFSRQNCVGPGICDVAAMNKGPLSLRGFIAAQMIGRFRFAGRRGSAKFDPSAISRRNGAKSPR